MKYLYVDRLIYDDLRKLNITEVDDIDQVSKFIHRLKVKLKVCTGDIL